MKNAQLPSPVTFQTQDSKESNTTETRDGTATPEEGRPSQIRHRTPFSSPHRLIGIASPPAETQAFSQIPVSNGLSSQVKDEVEEGVWGYLIPLDDRFGGTLVLRERSACPVDRGKMLKKAVKGSKKKDQFEKQEAMYEETKINGIAAGGYLIGRHPECGNYPNVTQLFPRG